MEHDESRGYYETAYFVHRTRWDGEKYVTERVSRGYAKRGFALAACEKIKKCAIEAGESASEAGYSVNIDPEIVGWEGY